jgi:hypothetical protein
MTINTPNRCAYSAMSDAPTAGATIVLLDTGNYPSFSSFLNGTWTWSGTNWIFMPTAGGGATGTFGVLAGSGITNTGATVVNGDIGSYPTATETGFPPGVVTGTNHAGDSVTQAAKTALTARYTAAQALPGGSVIAGGTIGPSTVITPGVYIATSSLNLTGGTVTLNGAGNYTFQIGTTLVTASATNIVLAGGATAANVTWAVGSSATLGTGTNFVGSILALTSITDNGGAVVNGQLLARNGAVTLNDTVLTVPAVSGSSTGPTIGRNDEVMVYDGYNVMMYGGFAPFNTSGVLQDTWVWNGATWTQLGGPTPPGPSLSPQPFGRYKAKAAYVGNFQAVMFGGENTLSILLETWLWNGSTQTWSQVAVPNGTGPAARTGHHMAGSDGYSNTALLFGGQGTNSQFNDTWTYTVAGGWVKQSPANSPSVRSGGNLVFDSVNHIWVLFGGHNEYNYLDETWVYNGTTWTLAVSGAQNGQGPAGRIGAQMAFDTTSGTTILFGGVSAGTNYPSNATWSFNSSTLLWTLL